MEEHYLIMDKPYTEIFAESIEDEVTSFVGAAVKTLYKAKAELVAFSVGTYIDTRFIKRIERFAKEEEILSPNQVKCFYKNIDESKLDLLFELLNKTRASTYDLHAKILAKLYGNFLKNYELNDFEETMLLNIDSVTKNDLQHLYEALSIEAENNYVTFVSDKKYKVSSITKFINMGLLSTGQSFAGATDRVSFSLNEYTNSLKEILELAFKSENE